MSVTIQNDQGVTVARLAGDLRGEDELSELFNLITGPAARVVLDLSAVTFLSSAGIGDMVRLVAQANTQEARVALAAPSMVVTSILEVTHLDRFFEIHPRLDTAIAALRG